VANASDGLEAIRQASALQPDLILLDISLPRLNGIEAGRRILAQNPSLKILFLTELRDSAIARAALEFGARGYILKSSAPREMLPAMQAIVENKRFVSVEVECGSEAAVVQHDVGFYTDVDLLIDDYAGRARAALEERNTFVILTGRERRHQLRDKLMTDGLHVDDAIKKNRYFEVDAADILSRFIIDGRADRRQFWKVAMALVAPMAKLARSAGSRVVVCGECAPTLLAEGHAAAAIQVEHLWDEFARMHGVDALCGYLRHHHHEDDPVIHALRAAHAPRPAG